MDIFMINPEVTVGNVLTIGTLILSVITVLMAWRNDRKFRQKEYAAPIRKSAGIIAVKLERWKEISVSFFDKIQPVITDADVMLANNKDVLAVRDRLWRDLVAMRSEYTQQILNENIETSYAELHGYDTKIQELFIAAVSRLRAIDQVVFSLVLEMTQSDVQTSSEPYESAKLGNSLRETCGSLMLVSSALMDMVIKPFQQEMTKVINASDDEIVKRKIKLLPAQELFSIDGRADQISAELLLRHNLSRRTARELMMLCEPRINPLFLGDHGEFAQLLDSLNGAKSHLIMSRKTYKNSLLDEVKKKVKESEASKKQTK